MATRRLFNGAQIELSILPIVLETGAVNPTGIPSAEAFGNATVTATGGGTFAVYPISIASDEAFGNAFVSTGGAVVSVRRYYPRHMRKFIGRR